MAKIKFQDTKNPKIFRIVDDANRRDKMLLSKLRTAKKIEVVDGKLMDNGLRWTKVSTSGKSAKAAE